MLLEEIHVELEILDLILLLETGILLPETGILLGLAGILLYEFFVGTLAALALALRALKLVLLFELIKITFAASRCNDALRFAQPVLVACLRSFTQ